MLKPPRRDHCPVASPVLRNQDGVISPCANRSWDLESGPTAEVTLQEQPNQIEH